MSSVGFIMLRHVTNETTNLYWIHCYHCIRTFYPENHILIIDDNSCSQFVTNHVVYNTTIIPSEYPGRGELLPYYYYCNVGNKYFDVAVILHDSVFLNQPLNVDLSQVTTYKMLWDFEHPWDQTEDELRILEVFRDAELTEYYTQKQRWKGCFGGMSIIAHDFLCHINEKYNLAHLLDVVVNRYNRSSFERVIACLLHKCGPTETKTKKALLGNIHKYCPWGITWQDKAKFARLPITKCWTGR